MLLTSLLMLVLLLVSLYYFWSLAVAVDAVMFLLSLLLLASLLAVAIFTVLASIPYFDCVHTVLRSCCCAHFCCCLRSCSCVLSSLMLLVAGVTVVAYMYIYSNDLSTAHLSLRLIPTISLQQCLYMYILSLRNLRNRKSRHSHIQGVIYFIL